MKIEIKKIARELVRPRVAIWILATIAAAVGSLTTARTCACKDALATAMITRPELVPDRTKQELAVIVGKYMK